jgi:hypothetical protein
MRTNSNRIQWPHDLRPEHCPVYTHNELEIPAHPRVVWAWLIRAPQWPQWYKNSKEVKIVQGKSKIDLAKDTVFTWKTFGMRVKTWVEVFEPFEQLAWRGTGLLGQGYHTWLIEKTPHGCKVITKEVQNGFIIRIGRWQIQRMLLKQHQNWLEGLAKVAQQGLPD